MRGIPLLIDVVPGGPETTPEGDCLSPVTPWRVVNIGNSSKVKQEAFIDAIEAATDRIAIRRCMNMQPGDVPATWADADLQPHLTGYQPKTNVCDGVARFVEWYRTTLKGLTT